MNVTTSNRLLSLSGVARNAGIAILASVFAFSLCASTAHADISSDLVGYWALNETSSDHAADSSGSGNTGAVSGTADWVSGKFNNAFNFDGSSYIEISRPVQDDFTMCSWFQTTDAGGGNAHFEFMAILDSELPVTSVGDFGLGIDSDGRLGYGGGGTGGLDFVNVLTASPVNDGLWHHGCVTRSESDGTTDLYLDGALADTDTLATGSMDANPIMRIGGFQDTGGSAKNFNGLLDDVRIYSRVLDATEIMALYELDPTVSQPSAAPAPSTSLPWCSGPMAPGWNVSLPGGGCGAVAAAVLSAPPRVASAPIENRYQFMRNLRSGMTGDDVLHLQQFLNANGFLVVASGPGSIGNETTYFGERTKFALLAYQNAHVQEILTPQGLTRGTGYFGASTRAFVNAL